MQKKVILFVLVFIVGFFIVRQFDKGGDKPKKMAFSYAYDIEDILESGGWSYADADDSGSITVRKDHEEHHFNVLSVDFLNTGDGIRAFCQNENTCITAKMNGQETQEAILTLHPGGSKEMLQVFNNFKRAVTVELAE
jgi:hypothetical protein